MCKNIYIIYYFLNFISDCQVSSLVQVAMKIGVITIIYQIIINQQFAKETCGSF